MATALRALAGSPGRAEGVWLRHAPGLTLALLLAPVAAGLAGTWLPAFGWLPAIGGEHFSLAPWRALFAAPELGRAVALTLFTGFAATLLSLALAVAICACCHGLPVFRLVRRALVPWLAIPHAALAFGLAFLIAPSGWIVRLVSPWLTGWQTPPDVATVQDPWGLALIAGLVLKETPYLLIMILAALGQVEADRSLQVARGLGYGSAMAWLKAVLPRVYPQIRLPVYAVLAFSVSVVDMAIILGPNTPSPLAPLVLRWFSAPDLGMRFQAAAGASLQLVLTVGAILAWIGLERLVLRTARPFLSDGRRGRRDILARLGAGFLLAASAGAVVLSVAGLALWSAAARWRFPDPLPTAWTGDTWARRLQGLESPLWTTVSVAVAAALAATVLTLACLENERRRGLHPSARALWLLYLPLLVPQLCFLAGIQLLFVPAGLDGTWIGLAWSHLLFVFPYVFLSLGDSFRALDSRYARTARCLGATPDGVFWRVTLPMLTRPVLIAFALGFSVSVALYVPTVLLGGGRLPTLTTEAVALAAGSDRRGIGVYAFLQAALPMLAFAAAFAVPAWLHRHRRGMAVAS
jgi:putative thiamine transport system permease protein